jgi:hypothetical protein
MAKDLFNLLYQWDREAYHVAKESLQGEPLLSSQSEWINQYFCSHSGLSGSVYSKAPQLCDEVGATIWKDIVPFFYKKLIKQDVSKLINHTLAFLVYLKDIKAVEVMDVDLITGAIKTERKSIERLMKINQAFLSRQKSWVYRAEPTESLESIDWNTSAAAFQEPDPEARISDQFRLITILTRDHLCFFKGLESQLPVVIKLDDSCCKHLESGDLIPMVLYPSASGPYLLFSTGYPVANV